MSDEPQSTDDSEFSELSQLADNGGLSAESFNQKLNSYAEAFRQEYEQSTKESPENVEQYTLDFFKKNIHSAAAQVVWLSNNADSETVRLSASKYVIDQALADGERDGDPIKDLLNSLKLKTKTKTTAAAHEPNN
jgi:hypothetical protein